MTEYKLDLAGWSAHSVFGFRRDDAYPDGYWFAELAADESPDMPLLVGATELLDTAYDLAEAIGKLVGVEPHTVARAMLREYPRGMRP